MTRLRSLYRLSRTLAAVWSWQPPTGIELFVGVDWDHHTVVVHLEYGKLCGCWDGPRPGLSRAEVHRRLEGMAGELLGMHLRSRPPGASVSLAAAGAIFEEQVAKLGRAPKGGG